jgi:hypothetical protein
MLVDFSEAVVIKYQNDRLDEGVAPKTINEEVGFLLRILGEPGDILRVRLRKKKMLKLKVRKTIGNAYSEKEKERMLEEAAATSAWKRNATRWRRLSRDAARLERPKMPKRGAQNRA